MIQSSNSNFAAIGAYENYGDIMPNPDWLRIYASRYMRPGGSISAQLAGIDMAIDLVAQRPEFADELLDEAEHCVDTMVAWTDLQAVELETLDGSKKLQTPAAAIVIKALLKRAELINWRRASQRMAVEPEYQAYLAAAAQADYRSLHLAIQGHLIEFIPILLGARALSRESTNGWFGRLALAREDKRRLESDTINPNWDCGLSLSSEANTFIHPPLKFQIKRSYTNRARSSANGHERAGISTMFASSCGLRDTTAIINSCLFEAGLKLNPGVEEHRIMNSRQLDNVTLQVAQIISPKAE